MKKTYGRAARERKPSMAPSLGRGGFNDSTGTPKGGTAAAADLSQMVQEERKKQIEQPVTSAPKAATRRESGSNVASPRGS